MKPARKLFKILLISACGLMAASCASKGIRGEPPFVQVNSLKLEQLDLALDLGVRNVNSMPILVNHIEFALTLNGTELAVYNAASRASIIANGTENLRFELTANAEGAALLSELEQGRHSNLEYTFEGVFQAEESTAMKVSREGLLYPVPGRPGQFR